MVWAVASRTVITPHGAILTRRVGYGPRDTLALLGGFIGTSGNRRVFKGRGTSTRLAGKVVRARASVRTFICQVNGTGAAGVSAGATASLLGKAEPAGAGGPATRVVCGCAVSVPSRAGAVKGAARLFSPLDVDSAGLSGLRRGRSTFTEGSRVSRRRSGHDLRVFDGTTFVVLDAEGLGDGRVLAGLVAPLLPVGPPDAGAIVTGSA